MKKSTFELGLSYVVAESLIRVWFPDMFELKPLQTVARRRKLTFHAVKCTYSSSLMI